MAIEQSAATEQGAHFGQYVEQMRAAWDTTGEEARPAQGQALLEALLRETPADEPWVAGILGDEPPGRELYRDPAHGFIQMGHFHRASHGNAPHDHGPCWVLYGVYRGEIEITTYRRLDDGSVPGQAQLEVKDVVRVKPGQVRPYLPGEIHSTRAIDPDGSLVMRFLSADLDKIERYRYKLETGQVVRV